MHLLDDFVFTDGIFDLVRRFNASNYKIIIVTNQSGIGRGYFTEKDFLSLTDWMLDRFKEAHCTIDGVYFCPDHPNALLEQYRKDSQFRKPNPGMITQAAFEHDISLNKSILIGDKETDISAGIAAGVATNILFKGNLETKHSISDLSEAIDYINNY